MPPSYRMFNYILRPAKNIERKMLAEAFRRLAEFRRVEDYEYIGFGSLYFGDFILFHRSLGFKKMISIEKNEYNKERFEFNQPFKCIDIKYGESNEVLPTLKWDNPTISWLDYDGTLNGNVLMDVRTLSVKSLPGSIIVFTVNAETSDGEEEDKEIPILQRIQERIGPGKVPPDLSSKDFSGWNTAAIYRRIITNEIQEALHERNGVMLPAARIHYKQIFNFHYRDGARMLTVGGILYEESQINSVEKCAFETLNFSRIDTEPCIIDTPNLTYKELRHLESQLPIDDFKKLKAKGIPQSDVEKFAHVYRYFPTFTEADL